MRGGRVAQRKAHPAALWRKILLISIGEVNYCECEYHYLEKKYVISIEKYIIFSVKQYK